MKLLIMFALCATLLSAETGVDKSVESLQESSASVEDVVVVKDLSGMSSDDVRKRANIQEKSKRDSKWEDLSPTPLKCDWVKTKSGEWFKGKIEGLFNGKLEFDSQEIGLYSFDFDDVEEIKSYQILTLNVENIATFPGIMRLKNERVVIIQGENSYEFLKKDVVSFAPDSKRERNYWSAKATASVDARRGNANQLDFSAKVNLKRRDAKSRLTLDYLGRLATKDRVETANDHRINQKYDRYLTRHFFWTPLFSEFYTDKYKNILKQLSAGMGVGYTLIESKKTTLSLSGGPAFIYTIYHTVVKNSALSTFSPAFDISVKYETALNKTVDITYNYKLTYTDDNAGLYKHHMLVTLENELTSWLDVDITGVWDYILYPQEESNGIRPQESDFQILIGFGVEF